MAAPHPLAGRRATLAEYHSLCRDGALGEDDRVQLLGGIIVGMTRQGHAHARAIQELTEHFVLALRGTVKVLVQLPLTLGDDSEPEPDVALVSREDAARPDGHPRAALLVVDVAGDSLRQDREVKGTIYARSGIPEYWIVNLADRVLEVYRDPDPATGAYATAFVIVPPGRIAPSALPAAGLDIAVLFR